MTTPECIDQKSFDREPKIVTQGSFFDVTHEFLELSGNMLYTKELEYSIDDAIKLLERFPDKTEDGLLLAGSFARYLTGNGDEKTNWRIREKAKEMQEKFIHEPENRADFERIAKPDQDIDTAFVFTNTGSLDTLFRFIKENAANVTEQSITKLTSDNKEIHIKTLEYTDSHHTDVHLEFGPVITNTDLIHMTMGFQRSGKRLFHIDIAEFPKDGIEAQLQKRIGGDTIQAQDIYIPITHNEQGETRYTIYSSKTYSVLHKEKILTQKIDKDKQIDIPEMAIRALRIHLIHSEKLFTDTSMKTLTNLFFTEGEGNLFDIRKAIQAFVRSGVPIEKEKMDLFRTELLISMTMNPYETARFLQDTGIYLLIPGLRNFNHADWKNFYTSDAMTFLQAGVPIASQDTRSMESVGYSNEQFKQVRWNDGVNGMHRFIRAFGEVMRNKIPNLDFKNTDQMYTLLFKTEAKKILLSEKQQATNLPNMLLFLLRTYPSGATEREIQKYLEEVTHTEISREIFQKALFEVKARGLIDRQTRYTDKRYTDKKEKVVFYSPRLNADGSLNVRTTPLTNPEIHTAITTIASIESQTKDTLERLLQELPCRSIESFRPLRAYEREFLASEIDKRLLEKGTTGITKDTILQFVTEVQQACVAYSRKRGL